MGIPSGANAQNGLGSVLDEAHEQTPRALKD